MALTKITSTNIGANAVTTSAVNLTAPLGFANSSANVVYMAANGNVGIGTSTPGFKIEVKDTSTNPYINIVGNTTSDAGLLIGDTDAPYQFQIKYSNSSDALIFAGAAGVSERMRIDSAGRVTTPAQPAFHAVSTSIKTITGSPFIFDTVFFNTGGHYNASNGRFTAPIAGIYYLLMDFLTTNSNTNTVDLRFYKNGTQTQLGTAYYTNYTGGDHRKGFMIALASLNASDYITVQTQSGGGNGELYGDTNESGGKGHTSFKGFLVG